jgi:hypothetical protein
MLNSIRVAAVLSASLAFAGCQSTSGRDMVGNPNLTAVAAKIDAGAQLAAADLPAACQIVGQLATLASVYSTSGLSGSGAVGLAKATNGASALAGSALCQNPAAADPLTASIQILGAAAAVKAATRNRVSAPVSAASNLSGN